MKRTNSLYTVLLFLFSFSFITMAEETAATSKGWPDILVSIATRVVIVLLPVIGGGLLLLGGKLLKKLHLEKNEVATRILTEIIKKAINYVERWANTQKNKPSSDAKLNKALEIIDKLGESDLGKSFITKNRDKIIARIESELEEIDPSYNDIDLFDGKK